jgi:N-methylhydantoinase B
VSVLDPISLAVLDSRLAGIAEEMGALLIRGAYSSNIKERRDCSAALFDPRGRMVAQAEHIPVHLGAMPEAVAAVLARDPSAGDAFIVNDPYRGGTHLPDVTIVSPVHADARSLIGFAVTRAHHSDVGGMRPGSMPSDSREVYQEGIVIPPVRLVREGQIDPEILQLILANVRTPEIRRGDLRAQLAANSRGGDQLAALADERGLEWLESAFDEQIEYAARRTRAVLEGLPDGVHEAVDYLEGDGITDEDIAIAVRVEISGGSLTIDFAGTSEAVDGNVNCPLSVTRSACYFALRVLLPEDVPRNAGTYEAVDIRAPEGSLVNAQAPSAVVAGNVETSQRIADAVLLALAAAADLPAQGQGTMNNLVIGGRDWTYYETIGGGQGASRDGVGPSGVHVGMSNTLNTPIEALELEFPLRVERQQLAYGSGGTGAYNGGDGIERAVMMLEVASLSLLTDRRRHSPRGADGGGSGAAGRNLVNDEEVPSKASIDLAAGDRVTIVTPGGGGWGTPARPT